MDRRSTGLPKSPARSPLLRVLAPLALAAALIAVIVVASNSGGDDEPSARSGQGQARQGGGGGGNGNGGGAETPKTYVVEPGDSLGTIAETFGVSVKRIERLNKGIDPNTLATGQELTLRE